MIVLIYSEVNLIDKKYVVKIRDEVFGIILV